MGKDRKPAKKHGLVFRAVRGLAIAVAVLAGVPLVLVPVYGFADPVSVPMLARMLSGQPVVREWRDIDEVSDRLKASVMMSEDGQFCRHHGVDPGALRAEFNAWAAGRVPRGASTISMQVARNLFLWNGRSHARKALEIPLAIYLDLVLSKRRIMEIYLNIAEWGPNGEFGIEAGVQKAFGVDAGAMSWTRAALMAVTLPNPLVRRPARPSRGLARVAAIVERRAKASVSWTNCLYKDGRVPEL